MSAYYRALALSREMGTVNSKYTDDEWAILGGVQNSQQAPQTCQRGQRHSQRRADACHSP